MNTYFHDRHDAGRQLAPLVQNLAWHDEVVVLALPRGGLPIGYEIARTLDAPLDILVVRKLGAPGFEELALGAIASGGVRVLNDAVVTRLELTEEVIGAVERDERRELQRRESKYRAGKPPLSLTHKTAVLADDGLATGATMRAAALAARRLGASRVIVAVPIASPNTARSMADVADDVVCVVEPHDFEAVGPAYELFPQLTDEDVESYLDEAALRPNQTGRDRVVTTK